MHSVDILRILFISVWFFLQKRLIHTVNSFFMRVLNFAIQPFCIRSREIETATPNSVEYLSTFYAI